MFARLLASCLLAGLAGLAAASPATAQGRLIVSTQGSVDKPVRDYLVPEMKQRYGIDVSTTPSLSAPALSKAIAQRNNPQIDVFLLDAGPWLQGKQAGLWTAIPSAAVPNLADVPASLRDPEGVAYANLVLGLLYDSTKLKTPPQSLRDLENPIYRGQIAVPTFSSTFAFALLAKLDASSGRKEDPAKPLDAGFQAMQRIAPNVANYYNGGAQLVALFNQHEIELAWGASYVASGLGSNPDVKWVAPSEGAGLSTVYASIAKGSGNTDAAAKFINLLISPAFQARIAEAAGLGYVNTKTVLTPAFAKTSPLTSELLANGTPLPWAMFNANSVVMNERWQQDIESRYAL